MSHDSDCSFNNDLSPSSPNTLPLIYRRSSSSSSSSDALPLIYRSRRKTKKQQGSMNTKNNSVIESSFHLLGFGGARCTSTGASDDSKDVSLPDDGCTNTDYGTPAPLSMTATTAEADLPDDSNIFSSYSNEDSSSAIVTTACQSHPSPSRGRLILLFIAIVYGSLNISMRSVFSRPDPPTASASSTIQGWFAVACFFPLLLRRNNSKELQRLWCTVFSKQQQKSFKSSHPGSSSERHPVTFLKFAIELALFNFGTQGLINLSLVATQGARASFLVQMSVVFTPVVSVLLGQQRVSQRVWIACFISLVGLFVLSYSEEQDYTTDQFCLPSLTFTWGDWCCLLAALFWSFYIYRLSAWGEYFDETATQFVKNIFLAILYNLWMLISLAYQYYNGSKSNESIHLWMGWKDDPIAWCILFYSALVPCTLADVLQQKAQASVNAAETNVILSLEPVFTTLLGFLLLGETSSLQELCGGIIIMIASVVASTGPQQQPSSTTAPSR